MRHLKSRKGFTLVEVIVVAVIVAALAAVAIPLYQNYVTSARQNTVNNAAADLASFVGVCEQDGTTITDQTSVAAGTKITFGSNSYVVPQNTTADVDATAGTVTITTTHSSGYAKTVPYK